MLWYPYARLCKHRSVISHFPFIGTAGRLLYLAIVPLALVYFLKWQPPKVPLTPLYLAIGGLAASDILHWAMDTRFGDRPARRRSRR
jgi:uncharacterized metal-binding protein